MFLEPELIMLSEADMERAQRIAIMRNAHKANRFESKDDRRRSLSDNDMHWIGVRAEVAICRKYRFPIDSAMYIKGDGGTADVYVGELRCEIKSSIHTPPIIKLNTVAEFTSDILIMTHVGSGRKDSHVTIWGYVTREQFIAEHEIEDFGQGPRAIMRPNKFLPHQELDAFVTTYFPMG